MRTLISNAVGAKVISLDDRLLQNGGIYWEQIDYGKLKSELVGAGEKIIIEGVCFFESP